MIFDSHFVNFWRAPCVKSVHIRSYSDSYFPAFGLNTEMYSVFLCIQSEWVKMRTRITPNTDTFYAVPHAAKVPHFTLVFNFYNPENDTLAKVRF